jgi:tyrosyl-tRNA synthetase
MTTPILEGLDGVKKMSKSYDNYIGVQENPKDMFGKTLRVSDELMFKYYELLTDFTIDQIEKMKLDMKEGKVHPKKLKVDLAKTLVTRFHSKEAADKAEKDFETVFVNKGIPSDIPEHKLKATNESIGICQFMTNVGLTNSNSEARRLIEGKAVEFDGTKKTDPKELVALKAGSAFTVKAGKHKFLKVVVE